jgi:glycosyltransferase involved in cell wall biosynthesis
MKLAVLTPIPTPYRDPFWDAVARKPDIDLQVFYCSAGKSDRPWRVNWSKALQAEVLRGRNFAAWRGRDASCYWNPDIPRKLRDGNFDAVILGGYNHLTMWSGVRYARKRDVPLFLMCESHLQRRRNGWRKRLKQLPVQWLVSRCAGGFPTGSLAEKYLSHYGAATDSLTRIPNVPDVEQLNRTASELRSTQGDLRREFGLRDRPTILFAARLIPKKRAGLLIEAFNQVRGLHDAQLVIVGDGNERTALRRRVEQLKLQPHVHFAGFVQPHEMPRWYAIADLFVLPSSETWGVAVLEALASGLPVIVTDEVGCHPDVVCDPAIGDVVPAAEQEALTDALNRRLAEPSNPDTIQRVWSPIRESLRYDKLAQQFVARIQENPKAPIRTRAA